VFFYFAASSNFLEKKSEKTMIYDNFFNVELS